MPLTDPTPSTKPKVTRIPSIINRKATKAMALTICRNTGKKFRRVGESFFNEVERDLRIMIAAKIHRHPSKGVTLMGSTNV